MHWNARGKTGKSRFSPRRCTPLLFFLVLLLHLLPAGAQTYSVDLANVPVDTAFRAISQQTGYRFIYTREVVENLPPVTLRLRQVKLDVLLEALFRQVPLTYTVTDMYVQVKKAPAAIPPAQGISGKVRDERGLALAGVTVAVKGRAQLVITDAAGLFSIEGVLPDGVLVFSSVGYETKEVPLNGQYYFVVQLTQAIGELDAAVVMAYGTTTRRYATGNITKVGADVLDKQPVGNTLAALEGRVPGLVITQSSGVPGGSFRVQLRGQSSIGTSPGNLPPTDPLFIVDGVPFAPNNTVISQLPSAVGNPGLGTAATGLSPFNTINPADIESIEVLKDADATAIYGSRGANGVILITTKKGKPGKTRVNGSVSHGWSRAPATLKLLNTSQYVAMRNEALQNDGVVPTAANAPDLVVWDTTRFTDFAKLLVGGTARTVDAQASLSGGSAQTQFQLSSGYRRETTVFPGDFAYQRGSVQLHLNHTVPDQRFQTVLSVLYSSNHNNVPSTDLTAAIRTIPNAPPLYDSTGNLNWQESGVAFANPFADLQRGYDARTQNLLGNLQLRYTVLPGLTLRTSLGYHTLQVDEVSLLPIKSQAPSSTTQGSALRGQNLLQSWIAEPQAEYSLHKGPLRLTILGGATLQEQMRRNSVLNASGYTNDALLPTLTAAANLTGTNNRTQYHFASLFGRVSARLKDRYLLTLSVRRDGSSRFGPQRRFGHFGAAGAGWIFSSEGWAKRMLPFLSFGKLRGSYGTTGNDQIGDYQYLDTWTALSNPYQGLPGLSPTRLYNPYFEWEVTRKLEGGLDLGFLANRILLSVALFRNRSSNQLLTYLVPSQTGFGAISTRNFPAVVQNSGLEGSVEIVFVRRTDFSWSSQLNFTVPRNRLISFPGLASSSYRNTLVEGRSLRVSRGYQYLGVNAASGLFSLKDVDGDGVISSPNDIVTGDSRDVQYYGGINQTIRYKGFSVDLFFEGRRQTGRSVLAALYEAVPPGYFHFSGNQPQIILDRWQKPGDVARFQRYTASNVSAASAAINYFTSNLGSSTDASFVRLRTFSLRYSLPDRWLRGAGLSSGSVYLQGQNLWTLTSFEGSDPETQNVFGLPPLRTVAAGIQISL